MEKEKKNSGARSMVLKVLLVAAILVMAGTIGIGDYSHVKYDVDEFNAQEHSYEIDKAVDEYMAYVPSGATKGIIFYPGGNVEYTAYMEMLDMFAEEGILCVAVHMPKNIPALGVNSADTYIEKYPQIKEWYMLGHDKGGTAAAKYVAKTDKDIKGLGIIASYTKTDLSDKKIKSVVMYGTADAMLSMINYKKGLSKMPEGYEEVVIKGANHTFYGHYEVNKEDAISKITREQQQRAVVDAMIKIMN